MVDSRSAVAVGMRLVLTVPSYGTAINSGSPIAEAHPKVQPVYIHNMWPKFPVAAG